MSWSIGHNKELKKLSRLPSSSNQHVKVAVLVTLLLLAIPRPTYAYIDFGTGSAVIQVLFALLFGIILALRKYWTKLRMYLSHKLRSHDPD